MRNKTTSNHLTRAAPALMRLTLKKWIVICIILRGGASITHNFSAVAFIAGHRCCLYASVFDRHNVRNCVLVFVSQMKW